MTGTEPTPALAAAPQEAAPVTTADTRAASVLQDWLALTRPRISTLVLVTVAVGACLAARGLPPLGLLAHALLGTLLVAASSSALNQVLERDTDSRMIRTRNRPLPTGRLGVGVVVAVSAVAGVLGFAELWFATNPVAATVAAVSHAIYVLAYTPLKRITTLNTVVGAVPGALPPLIGWSAVTGSLDAAAWTLFAIVFVWQFPHFLAIAWLNREDYARAGLKMLPAVERGDRLTGFQMTNYCLALLPVSLVPAVLERAGHAYFLGALYLGVCFLGVAISFQLQESRVRARRLLVASIVYLPALLGLMWLDRLPA